MNDRKLGLLLERIAHRDETQLVAVSGGRDSIALLDMLVRHGAINLIVAHLDHALRAGSGDDAKFVRAIACKYHLPIAIERCPVRQRARRQKQSLETAAREARYEFLARTARKHGARRLLLAHHADDQVETFLLNLFRGAGTGGLGAMRLQSNRTIGDSELIIERPLLGVWREEIDAYVVKHQLTFREDPTNRDREHLRNRVRHDLLPALEHLFGRKLRQTIWRAAEMLRAEDEWMRGQIPALSRELPVETLRKLPIPLQRRLLHQWLASERVPDIGYDLVERVRDLLASRTAKTNLPGGRHLRRRAGKLFIESAERA